MSILEEVLEVLYIHRLQVKELCEWYVTRTHETVADRANLLSIDQRHDVCSLSIGLSMSVSRFLAFFFFYLLFLMQSSAYRVFRLEFRNLQSEAPSLLYDFSVHQCLDWVNNEEALSFAAIV